MTKLDLDAAAAEIERRRAAWTAAGFVVGPLTWRDTAAGWPYPLVGRDAAMAPDSVGVRCRSGSTEFRIVLFHGEHGPDEGGWADVEGFDATGDDTEMTAPAVPDIPHFARLLDSTFARWSPRRPAGRREVQLG